MDLGWLLQIGFAWFFIWPPAFYWIMHLTKQAIMADLGGPEAALGIGAAIGVALIGHTNEHLWMRVSCASILWLSALTVPIVGRFLHGKALLAIDIERMRKLSGILGGSANNPSALGELGRLCVKYGLTASAVGLLERAVAAAPHHMLDEKRMLQWVSRDLKGTPDDNPNTCPDCGFKNHPTEVRCKRCGRDILASLAGGAWLPERAAGRLVRLWLIVVCVLVLAPYIGSSVHSLVAVPLILLTVAAGVYLFWRTVTK